MTAMKVLDIHTHVLPDQPGLALVALDCNPDGIVAGHLFSAGIHPWTADENTSGRLDLLYRMLHDPSIAAVGECGLDALKGPSLEIQTDVLIRQIGFSETFEKPVVLHVVRCFDQIIALKKRLKPAQRWLIHGFRGGWQQARQLTALGFELSLGLKSRPETMRFMPSERLFLETDGQCAIERVVEMAAAVRNVSPDAVRLDASRNASDFLGHSCFVS